MFRRTARSQNPGARRWKFPGFQPKAMDQAEVKASRVFIMKGASFIEFAIVFQRSLRFDRFDRRWLEEQLRIGFKGDDPAKAFQLFGGGVEESTVSFRFVSTDELVRRFSNQEPVVIQSRIVPASFLQCTDYTKAGSAITLPPPLE